MRTNTADKYTHNCPGVTVTVFQVYKSAVCMCAALQSRDSAAWQLTVSVCPLMVTRENAPFLNAPKTYSR